MKTKHKWFIIFAVILLSVSYYIDNNVLNKEDVDNQTKEDIDDSTKEAIEDQTKEVIETADSEIEDQTKGFIEEVDQEIQTLESARIIIQSMRYRSHNVTIALGQSVIWYNGDRATHTVTSDSGMEMNSGELKSGERYSYNFTEPGIYTYHCTIHPQMTGTVRVKSKDGKQ
ncbi:hypothetical protein GOV14_01515 [Candidatus Pacearchaeota archaeon]|nr:hypothetical protein [Candidatus Pacearchaeota archaeon]